MDKLGLVGGRHDDEVGQATEIGEIERARVRRPVGTDEPNKAPANPLQCTPILKNPTHP